MARGATPVAVFVRPPSGEDIAEIARLSVQLYASELPGALSGPLRAQEALTHFTLEANGRKALGNRYVACDAAEKVLATGMVQFPGELAFERAPDGTVAQAFRVIGVGPTLRLLGTVARSLVGGTGTGTRTAPLFTAWSSPMASEAVESASL